MSAYQLAQLNISQTVAPLESPTLAKFVENLDRINALAEQSPGFIWRLQNDDGNATTLRPFGEDILINLSVWNNIQSLKNYVYQSAHVEIMRNRKKWFKSSDLANTVLWWVPQQHIPTLDEAKIKLLKLQSEGSSQQAFTFKSPYSAPPPL